MCKKKIYLSFLLVVFTLNIFGFERALEAAKTEILTNSAIIKMVKAGLSDDIIISKIRNSKADFDLSTDGLISLKQAGINERIIKAMMGKGGISSAGTTTSKRSQTPQSETIEQPPAEEDLSLLSEDEYYARCNLKVIKGSLITWINWQAAPTFIPAGTRLKVTKIGAKATLINVKTGSSYTLDIGASGDRFLEKFVTKKAVSLSKFPPHIQADIKQGITRVGMTREQAYIAMGPPTKVPNGKTNKMTYKEIMSYDLWVYARRRFGKNIGVAFDPSSGQVNRTEGIWGK